MNVKETLFIGFNSRIVALDRNTGEMRWSWKADQGTGFVSLLLEGSRLFACVNGYTYCLDAMSGQQVWFNPLKGFGLGTASMVTAGGQSSHTYLGEAAAVAASRAAAAGAS